MVKMERLEKRKSQETQTWEKHSIKRKKKQLKQTSGHRKKQKIKR